MTCVGYGDYVPYTWFGQVVATMCMISVQALFAEELWVLCPLWRRRGICHYGKAYIQLGI